jgi:hypothetical protein
MTPKDLNRYYVTYSYNVHPKGLTEKQVEELGADVGASHDLLLLSLMHGSDGSMSIVPVAKQSSGEELDPVVAFRAVSGVIAVLQDLLPQASWQQALSVQFIRAVQQLSAVASTIDEIAVKNNKDLS